MQWFREMKESSLHIIDELHKEKRLPLVIENDNPKLFNCMGMIKI